MYVTLPTVPSQPSNTWEMPSTVLFTLQTGNTANKQVWIGHGHHRGEAGATHKGPQTDTYTPTFKAASFTRAREPSTDE